MKFVFIPVTAESDGEWTRERLLPARDDHPDKMRDELHADIWSGQIENISRIYRLNLTYAQVDDVTQEFADNLGAMSFEKMEKPHRSLRKWLDRMGVEYFDDAGRESYDVAMRREHGTLNRVHQL